MKLMTALALLGVLCLQVGATPVSAQSCKTEKECQRQMRQFFDVQKSISLNVSSGSALVEPDGRQFTVKKSSKFKFVGFLKLTVNGSGTIRKSFPNGEQGGTVTFDGVGTIEYNDSGQVVFESSKEHKLSVTAVDVTHVVLLDNTTGVVKQCKFVDAYRNSEVYALACDQVSAYTEATAMVWRCKTSKAHDNAKVTEVKSIAQ
ncbi:MAG: hypothetical protein K2Y22_05920 [Candidatus Obscuribacterales bacterium]|nr:hypothetical protein [Candidatus Obscuribacterales bacterium]